MARKSKSQIEAETFQRALDGFKASYAATHDQRAASLEDRRFVTVPGAQWDGAFSEQFGNRPKLEVDLITRQLRRAETEYRENRITVDFISKEGDEYDELADLCDGLFRADAMDSQAEEAIDTAFSEGLTGGFGGFRLTTAYEDEEDEDDERQRIRIEPVYEADQRMFFDPNAKLADKSDATWGVLLTPMSRAAFEAEYPDQVVSSFPAPQQSFGFQWSTSDDVMLAEYFEIETQRRTVYRYEGAAGEKDRLCVEEFDSREDFDAAEQDLFTRGFAAVGSKTVRRKVVHKWIFSGGGMLEDCGIIAGCEIPLVPFFASRAFVDGSEHWSGLVRRAKDPQRLRNMQLSALAEISATGGVDVPIFAPEQIEGYEGLWADSAATNPAYLLLNPLTDGNGSIIATQEIGTKKAPQIPAALAALIQQAGVDLADILGNQDNGDEYSSNLSGKAIMAVQTRLDRQVYLPMSNLAKAVRRAGQIWLGMARDVYVEPGRKMRVVGESDQIGFDRINIKAIDKKDGYVEKNNLRSARFDVAVDVGATSSSARSSTVNSMIQMLPLVTVPEDQRVILAAIARNMDGEGLSSVREYFRRVLVGLGVEDPTDEDREKAAEAQKNAQPDVQAQFLQAQAGLASAQAQRAQADTAKALADTELKRAQTAETLAGIDTDRQRAAIEAAVTLRDAATAPPQANGVSSGAMPNG